MNVLCFHGKTQTGEIFRTRLDPLVKKFSLGVFEFPDGPVMLEKLEGDSISRLSWWKESTIPQTLPVSDILVRKSRVLIGFSQGALLAIACGLKYSNVRLVIAAGPPDDNTIDFYLKNCNKNIKILVLSGKEDAIVKPESSRNLCKRLQGYGIDAQLELFDGNHIFPVSGKNCEQYIEHMNKILEIAGDEQAVEKQQEEMLILESIFGDECKFQRNAPSSWNSPCFQVTIGITKDISIEFKPTIGYPDGNLFIAILAPTTYHPRKLKRLNKGISSTQDTNMGQSRVFDCVAAVKDLIEKMETEEEVVVEEVEEEQAVEQEESTAIDWRTQFDELEEKEMLEMAKLATENARKVILSTNISLDDSRQGEWRFCVGLLGKPSAGKSSFFNACTYLEGKKLAEVGATPFTTIKPNFGLAACQYRKGFELKLTIKDVAGLVPGAYRNEGKGNRFLNDLLDASALLHICDASGSANDGGVILGEINADQVSNDALWVLNEVHLWIYGNVNAKWPRKTRKPPSQNSEKSTSKDVCSLFTGYHASHSMTMRAAKLADLDLEKAIGFTPFEKHKLVAFFIAIRFPVVLCLNKIDTLLEKNEFLSSVIHSSITIMGKESLVEKTSAKLENLLLSTNGVKYNHFTGEIGESIGHQQLVKELASIGGNTGIHRALVKAVDSAHPLVVTAILQNNEEHSFLMYPGSIVYDLYEVCIHSNLILGDYVRAEEVATNNAGRTLSRDALLRTYPRVKILTNRKISHQKTSGN